MSQAILLTKHHMEITSGAPQVSVLSSILFFIYVDDLIKSIAKLLADNTKLYHCISDKELLQDDLNSLLVWSSLWHLTVSILHY